MSRKKKAVPSVPKGGQILQIIGMFGDPENAFALPRAMTISEAITDFDLSFRLPTIAVLNGEPVLRGQWGTSVIAAADTLAFVAVPGGGGAGGGNNQGKQIMGLVAALALSVAAPFVGSMVAGALFGGSAIAASIASAAFAAGGKPSLNLLEPAQ